MAKTARKKAAPKQLTTAQRLDSIIKSARKIMRKDKGLLWLPSVMQEVFQSA